MDQETLTMEKVREEALDHSNVEREQPMKEEKGKTNLHIFLLISQFRVPALVTWPGMISPGVIHGLMSTLDIMPTVLGILGVESSLLDNILLDGFDLN